MIDDAARQLATGLDEVQAHVIRGMGLEADDSGFRCFKVIAREAKLGVIVARSGVRSLADLGLAVFARGLWTEDGEPYGAGYALNSRGEAVQRAVEDMGLGVQPLAPIRVQLRRVKGWQMPPHTVKVTRPGPWGNYAGPTKADFQRDLDDMPNADKAFIMDKAKELRGSNVACFCHLDQPCHADIWLELANAPSPDVMP